MPFIRLDPAELNPKALLKDTASSAAREASAVRRAAMEFEALLLKQLTAALNPSEEEDDGLFGSNESSFYKQMFSEQLATAMARNGGVGLADVIVQRLGGKAAAVEPRGAQRAVETARLVRASSPGETHNETIKHGAAQPVTPGVSNSVPREMLATTTSSAATPHVAPSAVSAPTAVPHARNAAAAAATAAVALHLPLKGRVSSGFGARHDPLRGGIRRHTGVDIAAPSGTPIAAAAAGKVVFAGRRGGYGNLVEIEHADGQRTRYAHTARLLVKVGDEVKPGQAIATVGSTGRSTGPHLHFEVKKDGARIDPLQAVAKDSQRSRR